MTNEEKLAVFKAHLDGKPIEFTEVGGDGPWRLTITPTWSFHILRYRAKPEEPAVSPEPDWKMRCIELRNENTGLVRQNDQLAEKNRQLQSAYNEMRGQRDALQDRVEAQRANFVAANDNFNLVIEQRDKAEEESDSLREKTNVLIAEVGVLKRAIQQFHNVTKFALDN